MRGANVSGYCGDWRQGFFFFHASFLFFCLLFFFFFTFLIESWMFPRKWGNPCDLAQDRRYLSTVRCHISLPSFLCVHASFLLTHPPPRCLFQISRLFHAVQIKTCDQNPKWTFCHTGNGGWIHQPQTVHTGHDFYYCYLFNNFNNKYLNMLNYYYQII